MPKDNHPPSFPFYVDDFIADSAVDAMTNEELGIYVRLLCKAWKESPVGTIPANDAILTNWAKATPRAWGKCRDGVLRAFVLDGERYIQKRMQREWQRLLENRDKRQQAGIKGADQRWHKDSKAITRPLANHVAKNGLSSSSSVSCSVSVSGEDVDDDGAIDISLEEIAEISRKSRRILSLVPCREKGDLSLIAKVAILWHQRRLSENDVEQVLESLERKQGIQNRCGWFYRSLDNRADDFEQMLATTSVPVKLLEAIE